MAPSRRGLRDIIPARQAVSASDLDIPPKTAWSTLGLCRREPLARE